VREAELEDARKAAQSISKGTISQAIEKAVDPTGEMKSTVAGVEKDVKSISPVTPVGPVIPPSPVIEARPADTPTVSAPEGDKSDAPADNAAAKVEAEAKA
jgi:hypothetical protein